MISGALVAAALVSGPVTSALAIFILGLAFVVLGYAALYRLVWLQVAMRTVTAGGSREKNTLTSTLIQASDELARLFSQEKRSQDLLPGLQAYLLGLTADDAHRAIRFTAPPPQTLMLPGPADRDTPDDADPAKTRDDGFARGFPSGRPGRRRGTVHYLAGWRRPSDRGQVVPARRTTDALPVPRAAITPVPDSRELED